MGNALIPGRQPEHMSGGAGSLPEAVPSYDGFGHAELIDQFYATEGDPNIGRELSVRLLSHAKFAGDPHAEPLRGIDGAQVVDSATGQLLTLADYVNFATVHHFHALSGILDFLLTSPGEQDYETGRVTVLSMVNRRKAAQG